MAKMAHSMIRVLDEARSTAFYATAFGMAVVDRLPFDGFTLIYLRTADGAFELELTVNAGRSEPYALGDGYGHLALVVDDLAAEHGRLSTVASPTPIRELVLDGAPKAKFFFVQDPDGYRIEVIQKGGRFS
jgi:lactoylglutathione lyase